MKVKCLKYRIKLFSFQEFMNTCVLYNDFIVNIYIQLDWEQVFTTY